MQPDLIKGREWGLASDCSGLDALVTGLGLAQEKLPLRFTHLCSADIAKHARDWTQNLHQPKALFGDMLIRDYTKGAFTHDYISGENKPFPDDIDLYAAGFPCQPFSFLNHESLLMDSEKSRPFWEVIKVIKNKRPRVSVLENVMGFMRPKVWNAVKPVFEELVAQEFYVGVVRGLSPHLFQVPLVRHRVYIIVADRKQVGRRFMKFFLKILSANMTKECPHDFSEILMANFPLSQTTPTTPCACTIAKSCTRCRNHYTHNRKTYHAGAAQKHHQDNHRNHHHHRSSSYHDYQFHRAHLHALNVRT